MKQDLICHWLRMPPGIWPPDPHTLLDLDPGECDPQNIEIQAQVRMGWLRPHQLTHPEEVTEAMNRLAQALVSLTDPQTGKACHGSVRLPASKRPSPTDEGRCEVEVVPVPRMSPPEKRPFPPARPGNQRRKSGVVAPLMPFKQSLPIAEMASNT